MSTIINGSSPSITFSDNTTQSTAALPLTGGTVTGGVNLATSSGNVGIGTASPSTQLELSSATPVITVNQNTINSDTGIKFKYSGNTVFGQVTGNASTGEMKFISGQSGQNGYYQTFATNGTERMRIDASGNLLVNTTSQFGTAKVSIQPATSSDGISVKSNGGGSGTGYAYTSTTTTGYAGYFSTSSGVAGSIYCNGTATTYATSSDYRLKENIVPMSGALDKVAALNPVTYTWKHDGSAGEGFIAHELQAVVPDCVLGEKDAVDEEGNPKYQGIDTSFLVATLTAAIQELKAELDATKAEVQALKAK